MTPGAVSQHIKALEDWIGADLFERRSQGVRLSAFGVEVAPGFAQTFDAMGAAVHGMRAALPELSISVSAVEAPPNLARELFDLSVFIRRPTGGARETVLAADVIFPVCTPLIAARLHGPADLMNETLLHDALWPEDWVIWGKAALASGDLVAPFATRVETGKALVLDRAGFDGAADHLAQVLTLLQEA